jgi:hypothetical protein
LLDSLTTQYEVQSFANNGISVKAVGKGSEFEGPTAEVRESSIFRDIMQSLTNAFLQVSCSAYSLALKMEATCSSETSVDFQRTTRIYKHGNEEKNYDRLADL